MSMIGFVTVYIILYTGTDNKKRQQVSREQSKAGPHYLQFIPPLSRDYA